MILSDLALVRYQISNGKNSSDSTGKNRTMIKQISVLVTVMQRLNMETSTLVARLKLW
jgi:hypothetical protein